MSKSWQTVKRLGSDLRRRLEQLPAKTRRWARQKFQRDLFPPVSFDRPLVANYCLIAACQMSCEFCEIWVRDNYQEPPPTDLHAHLPALAELAKRGVIWLNLSLGEPLLYPFLPEFLEAAREQGFRIALTTNGLLLPDLLTRLKSLIDRLSIKVFAPEEKDNDRICGQEGAWQQALDATGLAQKVGLRTAWKYPLNRSSLNALPDMINLAKQKRTRLELWFWPNRPPLGGFDLESLAYIRRCLPFPYVRVNNAQLAWLKQARPGRAAPPSLCRDQAAALTVGPDAKFIQPCFYQPRERSAPGQTAKSVQPDPQICAVCQAEEYVVPSIWQRRDRYLVRQAHSFLIDGVKGD